MLHLMMHSYLILCEESNKLSPISSSSFLYENQQIEKSIGAVFVFDLWLIFEHCIICMGRLIINSYLILCEESNELGHFVSSFSIIKINKQNSQVLTDSFLFAHT